MSKCKKARSLSIVIDKTADDDRTTGVEVMLGDEESYEVYACYKIRTKKQLSSVIKTLQSACSTWK